MLYFIILLIIIILLIPQIHYRKSNNLLQNENVEINCDLEFLTKTSETKENYCKFGNEKDFHTLPNFQRVKIKSYDDFTLDGGYFPIENSKAIVQIIHGALEHKERYFYLIDYLNKNGYSCFISDNRGHGRSFSEKYPLGYVDGVEKVVDDNLAITRELKSKFKEKDVYLIGHSLGTVFGRIYLEKGDNLIKKLALSGPPNYISEVPLAIFIGNFINFYFGERRTLAILKNLYNGEKKHFDWISYSKENILDAEKDPSMPAVFKNRGYLSVFEGVNELNKINNYKFRNPELEILFIAGEDDVVIGGEKGFESSIDILKKVGYKNISSKLYKNMKHEIFREDNREEVFKDLVNFLDK